MNAELIKKRISVRTYKEQKIPDEILEKVKSFLQNDTGLFNVPITFTILDAIKSSVKSPVIIGADTYIAGKYKKQKNADISFGYAFEKLVLYATSLGLGTVWLAATIDRKSFEKAIDLKEDEVMPAVTPIGYAADKRSLRESMMRKGLKSETRVPFDQLFFKDNFDKPLYKEESGIWALPLELVRLAPSATNKQPWRAVVEKDKVHFYEKKTKGYTSEDTGDIQKVDLGIALCHFEIAAQESGLEGQLIQKNPGLSAAEDMDYIATYQLEVK
ncbi:nitroreductase family protein [Sharpea porci]|uniref:nitroreductase family protein n=1 Tax=Sharpea porci TaxID=2652286 RepID=UPI002A91C537|nr:nitroreductase family protein [Sharpea porci]MDY5279140.1 nitroreductase family protein [Sharpea porci]